MNDIITSTTSSRATTGTSDDSSSEGDDTVQSDDASDDDDDSSASVSSMLTELNDEERVMMETIAGRCAMVGYAVGATREVTEATTMAAQTRRDCSRARRRRRRRVGIRETVRV